MGLDMPLAPEVEGDDFGRDIPWLDRAGVLLSESRARLNEGRVEAAGDARGASREGESMLAVACEGGERLSEAAVLLRCCCCCSLAARSCRSACCTANNSAPPRVDVVMLDFLMASAAEAEDEEETCAGEAAVALSGLVLPPPLRVLPGESSRSGLVLRCKGGEVSPVA